MQNQGSVVLTLAQGWVGLITSFNAFYVAAQGLFSAEAAIFQLPVSLLALALAVLFNSHLG
jgi:succinate-acetate transporter protein